MPRGKYPHIKRAGDFLFVSGPAHAAPTIRLPELEPIPWVQRISTFASKRVRVIQNIREILQSAGAQTAGCSGTLCLPGEHE